jgi:arylsulfatase A-like enzyme
LKIKTLGDRFMKIKIIIPALFFLLMAGCDLKEINADKTAKKNQPNILLLFSDDHQQDLIHGLGNSYIHTPHLDQLIAEGMTFTNAYAQTPTCVPSRASLLTGTSPLTHKSFYPKYSGTFNEALETWPETMKKAGYHTFWTGKWNAHGSPAKWGIEQTDALKVGGMGPHLMTVNRQGNPATGFSSELFADAAIDFLNSEHSKPFFMTVAFTAPHDPRTPPMEFRDMYVPNEMPIPANFYSKYPYEDGYAAIRDEVLLPYPRNVDKLRKEIALYYGLISHMDKQIGRILATLEKRNLKDNTIIIYASDNGLALGHHGLLGKFSFYRHSFNVPLIMSGPRIPKNTKSNIPIYLHDLFPTICEMTGSAIPETVESKSFFPIIAGKTAPIHPYIFGALSNLKRSVTTERFKLVRHYHDKNTKAPSKDEYLFFDLKNDSLEMINQINNPKFSTEIERLKLVLRDWQREKGDFLVP